MVGKIFICAEEVYSDETHSDLVDYVEHDYPKEDSHDLRGWFFTKQSCEDSIEYNRLNGELDESSSYYCVDRCFCTLYRIKIMQEFKKGNIRRAFILLSAGFKRMMKDFRE